MCGKNGGSKLVESGTVSGAASANASYWLTSSGPPTDAGRSFAALQPYVPSFEPQSTCTLAKTSNYNDRMHGKSAWRKRERRTRQGTREERRETYHEHEREKEKENGLSVPTTVRHSRFALVRYSSCTRGRCPSTSGASFWARPRDLQLHGQ